jgi:hypothetical protein
VAIVSVNEIWDGRDGSDDVKTRAWKRIWRIITDDPQDDGPLVMAQIPVSPGDPHPNDGGAYAEAAEVQQGSTRLVWLGTVRYTTDRDYQPNPVNDPAVITWDGEPFQRPLIKDRNGEAVLNSAGDPFDPPIMRDDNRPVVNVVKNVSSVPIWVLNYRDVVNSDAFTVDGVAIAAGLAKIKWIPVSERKYRNGISYRTLTFQIHLNKDGWNFKPLDMGYREKDGTDRKPIYDAAGKAVTQPMLLDGSGAKLDDPSPSTAVFLDYEGYEEAPFSILPLS